MYPEIDLCVHKKCEWIEFYLDANDTISIKASEPRGKEVDTCMFVAINCAVD